MKQVAAAVVMRDRLVLVTRRAPGEKLAGMWEFPGGKLEPGETAQQCIVREIKEELAVVAVAGDVFATTVYAYAGGVIELIAVEVVLLDETLCLSVHDAFKWVLPDELLKLELAPADIPIAEEIIRRHG